MNFKQLFCSLVSVAVITFNVQAAETSNRWLDDFSANKLPSGVTVFATDWLRWSDWNYFDPAAPGGNPDYSYLSNRLRFGVKAKQKKWAGEFSLQAAKQWSLPDQAAGAPGGALGLGAVYKGHNKEQTPSSLYVKYMNVSFFNIADSGIDATIGRFDYGGGVETKTDNKKINWLKKVRLDARLIGGFGWSVYQRSFDGLRLKWQHDLGQLDISAFRPTQGGFESNANKQIHDINVLATAYTFKPGSLIDNTEIQLFHYLYDDDRPIPTRSDNSGINVTKQDITLHTVGAHLVGAYPIGDGVADFLVWGAHQSGDWFEQNNDAYGIAVEAGYQWKKLPWQPWLRVGYYRGSGDSDPTDGTHETFFQMLPTVRKYAFTTAYNLMNNTDRFVQLLLKPTNKLSLRSDFHFVQLTESADHWWGGAGATQQSGTNTGYAGRLSGGDTDLVTTVELTVTYQINYNVGLHVFYGHLFGHDVVENNFADDNDMDFFFTELTFRF